VGAAERAATSLGCHHVRMPERVFLVDGTYELFRHFFGQPPHRNSWGREVAATRGVLASVLSLIEDGATHLGVATDHVIESFRNALWPGYKTSAGVDPVLLSQFGLLEEALSSMGVVVWPMVDLEADDALASAASVACADPQVTQVVVCTPDKDLAQCVQGARVVQLDRRRNAVTDEAAVVAKFGVPPSSIPDWLALVGDSADGYPGLPGWGPKSAAAVLSRFGRIEDIPPAASDWAVPVRGAASLAASLTASRDLALLFKDLATLRRDPPVLADVAELRWAGPAEGFARLCEEVLDSPALARRAGLLAARSL
jgi:5'-3' exonuclease